MSIKTIVQGATQQRSSGAMFVAGLLVGASALYGTSVWAADAASNGMTTASATSPAAGTSRILVLAPGGTISGTADPRSAIGYNSGNVKGRDLVQGVPGIEKLATVSAGQIPNVGS